MEKTNYVEKCRGKVSSDHRGITLIALIVTIIVLLILAGVSLNLVSGSDGILGRATNAVSKADEANAKEQVELFVAECMTKYYMDGETGSIQSYIESQIPAGGKTIGAYTLKLEEETSVGAGCHPYPVVDIKKIASLQNPTMQLSAVGDKKLVVYKGTTKIITGKLQNSGSVTWDDVAVATGSITTPVTPTTYTVTFDSNGITEATNMPSTQQVEQGSEVTLTTPVDSHGSTFKGWSENKDATTGSNSVVMGTSDITLYAIWERSQACNAAHPELHIPTGFAHLKGTVTDGYVITDGTINGETSDGNEFVWIPVANEAAYTKQLGTNNWYLKTAGSDTATSLSNTVSNGVKGDKLGVANILGITIDDTNYESTVSPEKAVVYNAGGFWVGRYEAGTTATTAETETTWAEENAKNRVVSKVNMQPVRKIYQSQALSIANNWKSGLANTTAGTVAFQSGLITGAQWDAMCKFIGWSIADSDCRTWGNYSNVASKTYTETIWHSTNEANDWINESNIAKGSSDNPYTRWIFSTGKFEISGGGTTDKKNIYDVAGNVWEWTTEIPQYSSDNIIGRGGGATDGGVNNPATRRNGNSSATTKASWTIGFRLVLYVE